MDKPLFILPIADPHTGSIHGLHPYYIKRDGAWITVDEAGGWFYKNNPHYYLNSKQVRMWRHYEAGIESAAALRKSKDCDLLMIIMGDAIDGDHHQTHELASKNEAEQMKAFTSIMRWTFEKLEFKPGRDKFIVIEGTEAHTRDNEEIIGQELSAEKFEGGASCTSFLEMEIQGRLFWFYHHGAAAGYSFKQGQNLFNYVKEIYVDCRMNRRRPPDFVMTADKHKRDHQTYRHDDHEIHGLILPPFQEKTRFTRKLPRAIVHESGIGFSPVMVESGVINVLKPFLHKPRLGDVLKW